MVEESLLCRGFSSLEHRRRRYCCACGGNKWSAAGNLSFDDQALWVVVSWNSTPLHCI